MQRLLFIAALLSLSAYSLLGQADDLRKEISYIIKYDTELELNEHPGFHVSVIDHEHVYHLGFGPYGMNTDHLPNENDLYEIGSITKSFTAWLTLAVAERGMLNLDDRINKHLSITNPRMNHVTIHDLMIHTSGLPKRPSLFGSKSRNTHNPYSNYRKRDLLKFYASYIPTEQTPSYAYSHTNYGLLEIILEEATDKTYQELLELYILNPLEMDNTFAYHIKEQDADISIGYDKADRQAQHWEYSSFAGSEGIKSSSIDLVSYVREHLADTLPSALTNTVSANQEEQLSKTLNQRISSAYGWQIYRQSGFDYPIYTFAGKTSGHAAFIAYIKETNTAVVLLSNSVKGVDNLGMLILRLINYNWDRKV